MDTAPITDALVSVIQNDLVPIIQNAQQKIIDHHNLSIDDVIFKLSSVKRKELEESFVQSTLPVLNSTCLELFLNLLPHAEIDAGEGLKSQEGLKWYFGIHLQLLNNCSINIALNKDGEGLIGLVWNSNHGNLFIAEKEYGSPCVLYPDGLQEDLLLEEKEISSASRAIYLLPDNLIESTDTVPSTTMNEAFHKKHSKVLSRLSIGKKIEGQWLSKLEQISGSICLLATNNVDMVYAGNFNYAFASAGIFVLEQAGGVCTDFSGEKTKVFTGEELFCANKNISRYFLER